MRISLLRPDEEARYLSWLQTLPASMVYFTPCFRRFVVQVSEGVGQTLIARRAERIVGALPVVSKHVEGIGAVFNSQPWYGSHGGCILADPTDSDVRHVLLEGYRSLVEESECLFSNMILTPWENMYAADYLAELRPCTIDMRIGQITELPEEASDVEGQIELILRQKTRNLVRKARAQEFVRHVGDDDWAWRFLIETHAANMQAIGSRPKPENHFSALRDCIPSELRQLSVALSNGTPVAAMLLVMFHRTVEYVTPVIRHDFRPRQPLSFLIWEAMLESCRLGFRYWNWGGTWVGQSDLHHFKAGFGAKDYPYTYLISASKRGLELLDRNREDLFTSFPSFYLYPLGQLGR
jgi:hypothetical protein